MLVYYLVVSAVALIFFLLISLLKKFFIGLSLKSIFLIILWVYLVSLFLPGLMSVAPPVLALLGVFSLIVFGCHFLLEKTAGKEILQEKAVSEGEQSESGIKQPEPVKVDAVKGGGMAEALPVSRGETALQVRRADPASYLLAGGLPALPKELVILPSVLKEPLYLLYEGAKAQNKEVALLTDRRINFQELINSAFQAKEEKNFALAVERFKSALSLSKDISVKGMIYTEFVFLYKEMGKYLEAAGLVEGFLLENSSSMSQSLRLHFEKVVRYLLTLDELLKKAGQPDLPFSQIPHLIKVKAEKVFQD
mgnify:CR=1 FL=1